MFQRISEAAASRTLNEDGRATDGQPINPGDVFTTASGRVTTPYPKRKSEKYASQWLIDNATAEAQSRGDNFNARGFQAESIGHDGLLAPASSDSMLMYLFGQQPPVVPSILRTLASGSATTAPSLLGSASTASFSDCKKYRYSLWRSWDETKPTAVFLMLNPSTADELTNDNTVERCQRRANSLGYGSLKVVNLFAFRSTDPQQLYLQADPIGPENDEAILKATTNAGIVICGWGTHGSFRNRGAQVVELLRRNGIKPYYLVLNKDGSPGHPLYVAYKVPPKLLPDP
jgi:hypothetical protein